MRALITLIFCTLLCSCGIVGIKSNYESPLTSTKIYSYDLKAKYILPQHSEREQSEIEKEISKKMEPITDLFFGKKVDAHSPDLSIYLRDKLAANGQIQNGKQTGPQYNLEFNYVIQEIDHSEFLHLLTLGIIPEEIHFKILYEIIIKDTKDILVFQDTLNDLIKVKYRETWGRLKFTHVKAETWELQKKHAYNALTQSLAKFNSSKSIN